MNLRKRALGILLFALTSWSFGVAQENPEQPVSAIEVVAVRSDGVDVKLRSVWPYSVSVWACDSPRRLNALGYYLEGYTGKDWKRLEPNEDHAYGDLKPEYLEIGASGTGSLPAIVNRRAYGGKASMKLRIVVRAWRTQRNAIGMLSPVSQEPLLLTSAPFLLQPSDGNSQH